MPPIWVGFWAQNSLDKGPFFGRFSINMGGFSRNWRKIVKNGWFSAKIHHKSSLRADFTIVEEFEGEKEKVKSAHSFQLFRSRDKSYPPSSLYMDQLRSVFDFAKVLFSLTLHYPGYHQGNLASDWLELGQ